LAPEFASAQLRGHGGPVRALAISPDGTQALSGSFDTSAIRWSLPTNTAEQVLRFHDGAVNAVAFLKDGRVASSGEDARIAIWKAGEQTPAMVLEGHKAPVVALAVSPDGAALASASWDHTARLWPLASGGEPRVIEGHQQNVNGIAFTPDGRALVTAGYDATLRISPLDGGAPTITTLPTPLNTVAVTSDGEIVTAGADGKVYVLSGAGEPAGEIEAGPTPIIAVAVSGDGKLIAAAGIRGSVAIIDRRARKLDRTLVGPGLPVWSVAFFPDGRTLLTGGADRLIRRWDALTEPIGGLVMEAPEIRRAQRRSRRRGVRACVACHAQRQRGRSRRADARRHLRAQDRDFARYNFSAALEARHPLDAGDGGEAVRGRAGDVHAGHQDARADHRLGGRQGSAGEVFGEGDEIGWARTAQPLLCTETDCNLVPCPLSRLLASERDKGQGCAIV
jgi:cytochrome c